MNHPIVLRMRPREAHMPVNRADPLSHCSSARVEAASESTTYAADIRSMQSAVITQEKTSATPATCHSGSRAGHREKANRGRMMQRQSAAQTACRQSDEDRREQTLAKSASFTIAAGCARVPSIV